MTHPVSQAARDASALLINKWDGDDLCAENIIQAFAKFEQAARDAALREAAEIAAAFAQQYESEQARGGSPALLWDQALTINAAILALIGDAS